MKFFVLVLCLLLSNVSAAEGNTIERNWDGSITIIRDIEEYTEEEYKALVAICKEVREKHCRPNDCDAISVPSCPYNDFQPPVILKISPSKK
ncbi:hypothetical protein KC926_00885 [Candidatus Kaiserbacteria bacterium]|nr:hypothetical protein [Candidatus Kaiserbacteria bacterium]